MERDRIIKREKWHRNESNGGENSSINGESGVMAGVMASALINGEVEWRK